MFINLGLNAQNPVLVKDIASFYGSKPSNFIALGSNFLFAASGYSGSSSNRELYISDGTTNGTQLLLDIIPGSSSSSPDKLIKYGNKVYFVISDNTSGVIVYRPWVTDGTIAGTLPLFPSAITTYGYTMNFPGIYSAKQIFTEYQGEVYFVAINDNLNSDRAIFKTNGTVGSTQLAVQLPNSTTISNLLNGPLIFNDSIYFTGTTNGGAFENLYKSDGTIANTILVKNNVKMYSFSGGATYNNKLYFTGTDPTGINAAEPWVTDGTPSGTFELANLQSLASFGSDPAAFTKVNGKLVFLANTSGSNAEMFVVDSINGNSLLSLGEVSNIGLAYNSDWFYSYNGTLLFRGCDAINGYELWKSNGTTLGTSLITDITPGSGSSNPSSFIEYCGEVYFTANNPLTGSSQSMYKTNGTLIGTSLIPGTIANPSAGAGITAKGVFNNLLYFSGQYDTNVGEELYSYQSSCSTGLNNLLPNSIGQLNVFPNPVSKELNINTDFIKGDFTVQIYSSKGDLIIEKLNTNTIETSELENGIYLIKLILNNSYYKAKFIKE